MAFKTVAALMAGALLCFASWHEFRPAAGEKELQSPGTTKSPCEEWTEVVSHVTADRKEALKRDGAVYLVSHLALSESLVPDCDLRGEMSSYFGRVLALESKGREADRRFAAQHSKEIVGVLRALWPSLSNSKALLGDAGFKDIKYVLLAEPALAESDIAPLISDILEAETIDNNLARILFLRPLPQVKPSILKLQQIAERVGNNSWQILNLALLNRMGDASALPKLKKLLRNSQLTKVERKYLVMLIAKAEQGEEIKFSDVENLEYEN